MSATSCVQSIAALRALAIPAAPTGEPPGRHVLGYHNMGDGGGGLFYWDAASAATRRWWIGNREHQPVCPAVRSLEAGVQRAGSCGLVGFDWGRDRKRHARSPVRSKWRGRARNRLRQAADLCV